MANLEGMAREMMNTYKDVVNLYNCDPSRSRGGGWFGKDQSVPALGQEGNPKPMPRQCAAHLLRGQENVTADARQRGWLTMDAKAYGKCQASFEESGKVQNPGNAAVWATANGTIEMDLVEAKQIEDDAIKAELLGNSPPSPPSTEGNDAEGNGRPRGRPPKRPKQPVEKVEDEDAEARPN